VLGEDVIKAHFLVAVTEEHNRHFEGLVGTKYSYGSYKNHKTTLSYLKEFVNKYYHRKDIALKNVDYKFCEKYFHFLTTEKPCNNNGANKHIQRLKKIINYALKMGYTNSNSIASFSVKFTPYNRAKLTWEEILKLQRLKVNNPTLKKVLDIFLFQCYTGLSYADVKKLNRANIITGVNGKAWISMARTKTKQVFTVPILKPAERILSKYSIQEKDDPIFAVLSNQKMNSNLKVLAEIAGLKTSLTCHVARHAFATTITLQAGVPIETVSKMLGHSSIKTTQIYATVTELKISKDMESLSKRLKK
jgi:site-specific recombinase XerD